MYTNSEKFLTAFNRIEKILKTSMYQGPDIGFSKTVRALRDSNALIKRYSDDLLEFAELRNAIVHNKIDVTHAIAEPHNSIVARIEEIESELTLPKKVTPLFSRSVYAFQESTLLEDLLVIINEKGLSKFPIYNDTEFLGLLTQKGIANWLAVADEPTAPSVKTTLVKEVLRYEDSDNAQFISSDTLVYEAVGFFKEQISQGRRLEAMLITKNGKSSEKLFGIITAWDILEIP
ncbi:CBS domain-containing protein [Virgibacillus sp. C22-A2]|uniref:CBS domain-containing protein n=1 Tax=Virgibacillus tibetensis TaxID=3042313 RepID=A0ABU6KFZ1_9BACI|nr:CBS domain-containing protein [Virgibacillus sp. C22-A2]